MALRIGVVGVGHMGRRHAEKVVALRNAGLGVTLSGVVDLDPERARGVASDLGVRAAENAGALFREADAAVVAVPTIHHYDVARRALDAGLDVLIEKPIAATLTEGEGLLRQVARQRRVLHVGHLERYNAATRAVRTRVREPRFVEVHRVGPFPARGTDVDVVRDLMIHDIDILQQLLGEEPDRIDAIGVPVVTDKVDVANARLGFPSGCVANLTASRVSASSKRRMRLFQRDAYLSIDFLAQTAAIYRRVEEDAGDSPRVEAEKVDFNPGDALLSQLRAFIEAAKKRDASAAPAAGALGALRTAVRVIDSMPGLDELG